eukprot:CAMPEP_0172517282 /NCGR_PEP_ID=MMETSP1066-20121228/283685_1 /TAXON_ID=671091 /ORGANISM="Coscinodiscus wailesii, Strain CCMP2513" /LENGTH=237 /DNA_ID=CAMNT_0013299199 /DNA_START=72 /DNA_END=781 /DNA_ORIENTATION=-
MKGVTTVDSDNSDDDSVKNNNVTVEEKGCTNDDDDDRKLPARAVTTTTTSSTTSPSSAQPSPNDNVPPSGESPAAVASGHSSDDDDDDTKESSSRPLKTPPVSLPSHSVAATASTTRPNIDEMVNLLAKDPELIKIIQRGIDSLLHEKAAASAMAASPPHSDTRLLSIPRNDDKEALRDEISAKVVRTVVLNSLPASRGGAATAAATAVAPPVATAGRVLRARSRSRSPGTPGAARA